MPETITLAERLASVFAQLHAALPAHQNISKTLSASWREVVGHTNGSNLLALTKITLVLNGVLRLESQVKESKRLREVHKIAAQNTLERFKGLFNFDLFNQSGFNLRDNCNPDLCGQLALLGVSLESEFKEPRFDKVTREEITTALKEVEQLLRESSVPLDLKVSLQKLLDAMLWLIDHPDIASPQDLLEACGAAMVVSRQIRDTGPIIEVASDTTKHEPAEITIWTRMVSVGSKIARFVGAANKAVDAANQLSGDAHHLIEAAERIVGGG